MLNLNVREILQERVVAAMTVDDQNLVAAIARHFLRGLLQEIELQALAIRDGSGLMLGFEDLTEVVLGEDHGIFLPGGIQARVPYINKVRPQRPGWAVLFDDSERQYAGAPRLFQGFDKVRPGKLFPSHGQRLRGGGARNKTQAGRQFEQRQQRLFHVVAPTPKAIRSSVVRSIGV